MDNNNKKINMIRSMFDLSMTNKTGILKIKVKKESQYPLNFVSYNKYETEIRNKVPRIKGK